MSLIPPISTEIFLTATICPNLASCAHSAKMSGEGNSTLSPSFSPTVMDTTTTMISFSTVSVGSDFYSITNKSISNTGEGSIVQSSFSEPTPPPPTGKTYSY